MEYAEVKDWLDKLVSNYQERHRLRALNSSIRICYPNNCIQLTKCINIVADIMGIEVAEEEIDCGGYRYQYSFAYGGVKFIQIEEERLVVGNVPV